MPVIDPENLPWRCFHCGDIFTDEHEAAMHFGVQIDGVADDVACKLNAGENLILEMLRESQAELRRYHEEDTNLIREVWGLGAKSATEIRNAEETGYARGLRDAKYEGERFEAALAALKRLAIVEVHRPAHNQTTVLVGWRCKACDCEAELPIIGGTAKAAADIPHATGCPLGTPKDPADFARHEELRATAPQLDAKDGFAAAPAGPVSNFSKARVLLQEKHAAAVRADQPNMGGCTSYIQRHLGLGYNAAAQIIEELEAVGFLSKPDGNGHRTLLGAAA